MIEVGNGKLSPIHLGFAPLFAISKRATKSICQFTSKTANRWSMDLMRKTFQSLDTFGGAGDQPKEERVTYYFLNAVSVNGSIAVCPIISDYRPGRLGLGVC